jgi:hypothetical protein
MYFNLPLFLKALRLSLFRTRFSLRRWAYVLSFSVLFLAFLCLVAVARGLDHLFFPAFRRQRVPAPVFIIAPPRSGTTLLQKLLCRDSRRFVHLKMYQTIFPSVCCERAVGFAAWLDCKLGSPIRKLVNFAEKKWFGGWDDMHKMRLDQPEEDDALFLYAFASEAIFLLFPHVDELWEAGFCDALPRPSRRKLMRYFRTCLQRHLSANGPDKTLLSKSTQSCGSVRGLLEEFPDARFITIFRDPFKSVASHVSVFMPVWQAHSPDIQKDGPVSKAYARLAVEWYKHLEVFEKEVPPGQFYCMDYRELASDPKAAVSNLYRHFGWDIHPDFLAHLQAASEGQKHFKSKHEYTLEEFGLSREWIEQELGEVIRSRREEFANRKAALEPAGFRPDPSGMKPVEK